MSLTSQENYLNSLLQMVSSKACSFPDAFSHLRNILYLLRHKWICDFLFKTEGSQHFILTGPSFTRNAIACNITIQRFQPANLPNPYRYHYNSSMLFIPASSINNISVGFGVEEREFSASKLPGSHDTNCKPYGAPQQKQQFRYVRDDIAGTLTVLYDCGDHFQIDFTAHLSTRHRHRSRTKFNRSILLSLIQRDGWLDEERARPALTAMCLSDEYRPCPICRMPSDFECSCVFNLVAPAHPLDFSNHACQMSTHVGSFDGLLRLMNFSDCVKTGDFLCGNRIGMLVVNSADLRTRLIRWALRPDLEHVNQDPLGSTLPPGNEAMAWDPRALSLAMQPQDSSIAFEVGSISGSQGIPTQRPNAPASFGIPRVMKGNDCLIQPNSIATSTGTPSESVAPLGTELGSAGEVAESFQPEFSHDEVFDDDIATVDSATPGRSEHVAQLQPLTETERQQQEIQRERNRKKEIKKARNRISARRSNQKKKLENDARKDELRALKEREVQLRARERVLRRENWELKQRIKEKFGKSTGEVYSGL